MLINNKTYSRIGDEMEKREEVKKLIKYLVIIVVILIVINVVIGWIAMGIGYPGFPGSAGPWYILYSVLIPAINALITGISIGFGILIAHKLVR